MAEGGKYLNMKYWELLKEENEAVAERHELAMERIGHMKEEATVGEPYRAFFERTVLFRSLHLRNNTGTSFNHSAWYVLTLGTENGSHSDFFSN